jgi:hypothetical protein
MEQWNTGLRLRFSPRRRIVTLRAGGRDVVFYALRSSLTSKKDNRSFGNVYPMKPFFLLFYRSHGLSLDKDQRLPTALIYTLFHIGLPDELRRSGDFSAMLFVYIRILWYDRKEKCLVFWWFFQAKTLRRTWGIL